MHKLRTNASLKAVAEYALTETRRAKARWERQQKAKDGAHWRDRAGIDTQPNFTEWNRISVIAKHLARLAGIEADSDLFAD